MIKYTVTDPQTGKRYLWIVLTAENVKRLREGEPIRSDMPAMRADTGTEEFEDVFIEYTASESRWLRENEDRVHGGTRVFAHHEEEPSKR